MKSFFTLANDMKAIAHVQMNNDTVKKLWHSFCLTQSELEFTPCDEFSFCIGNATPPALPEGKEYALTVDQRGAAITGNDYGGLMRGFFALLMKIEQYGSALIIRSMDEQSNYLIKNRMIHICVFPENDLYFIKKLIRLSALCQYTHIVIEFWGMLKYDCLKELAWPHAFTKEQAKELIQECRELGIEPIPMFNQLGHATGSRRNTGKHVVLDQNPSLQKLFTPDGWAWDITSEEVFTLLKQIRNELYDLFGEGEFIHIGCDEAYYITRNEELRKQLPHFLSKLTSEVELEGRRPMLWMDMLLEEKIFENCYTVGKKDEVSALRNATAKSTVFVDWQYDCHTAPIPSLLSLADCDHDVIGAPWYDERNNAAHIQTVSQNDMFGVMLTTWHTLKSHIPSILGCAKKSGAKLFIWREYSGFPEETATLLRRVSFEGNTYTDSGWSKEQIEV